MIKQQTYTIKDASEEELGEVAWLRARKMLSRKWAYLSLVTLILTFIIVGVLGHYNKEGIAYIVFGIMLFFAGVFYFIDMKNCRKLSKVIQSELKE